MNYIQATKEKIAEKRKNYNQRVQNIEKGNFSPIQSKPIGNRKADEISDEELLEAIGG